MTFQFGLSLVVHNKDPKYFEEVVKIVQFAINALQRRAITNLKCLGLSSHNSLGDARHRANLWIAILNYKDHVEDQYQKLQCKEHDNKNKVVDNKGRILDFV